MSDWVKHDGKGSPIPLGTMVTVKFNDGTVVTGPNTDSQCWYWNDLGCYDPAYVPIVEYVVPKPKGMAVLETILNKLPELVE